MGLQLPDPNMWTPQQASGGSSNGMYGSQIAARTGTNTTSNFMAPPPGFNPVGMQAGGPQNASLLSSSDWGMDIGTPWMQPGGSFMSLNSSAQGPPGGTPVVPGYSGGWTPTYGNDAVNSNARTLQGLIDTGGKTREEVLAMLGIPLDFANDPANADAMAQFLNTNYNSSYYANDQQGLYDAFGQLSSQPNGGYVNDQGQYVPPGQQPPRYIIGGQYYDNPQGSGNPLGPANTNPVTGQPQGPGAPPPSTGTTPYGDPWQGRTPFRPGSFTPTPFNPTTSNRTPFQPTVYNPTGGGSTAPYMTAGNDSNISAILGMLTGGNNGSTTQPGIRKLSSSTLNGDIFSAPVSSQDYGSLRSGLQQFLMQNIDQLNGGGTPNEPGRVNIGTPGQVGAGGVNIDSASTLGGATSPFFQNMMAQYEPLFAQERARTIAQAKESSGNLTGTGYANNVANALNRTLTDQQAKIADLFRSDLANEQARQSQLSQFAQERNLAGFNTGADFMKTQGGLDQQRNLSIFDTLANLSNSQGNRYASLLGQTGTAGVGQDEIIAQGGLGALIGPLLGALGNSSLGGGLAALGGNLASGLTSGLGNLAGGIGTGLGNLAGGLGDLGGSLIGGLGNLAGGLGNLGGNLAGGLSSLGGNLAGGLGQLGGDLLGGLGSLGGGIGSGLGLLAGGLGDLAGGLGGLASDAMGALGDIDWGKAGEFLKGLVPDNLIGKVGEALKSIPGLPTILDAIKKGIPTDMSKITEALKKIGINDVGTAYGIAQKLAQAGIIRGTAGQVLGGKGNIDWNSVIQGILGGWKPGGQTPGSVPGTAPWGGYPAPRY